ALEAGVVANSSVVGVVFPDRGFDGAEPDFVHRLVFCLHRCPSLIHSQARLARTMRAPPGGPERRPIRVSSQTARPDEAFLAGEVFRADLARNTARTDAAPNLRRDSCSKQPGAR